MRFGKSNFKRAVSAILAASLIFGVTPVSAIDETGEAEITVTDFPVIGDEIIPVESETEVVTETTVPEISEIPETSETVTEPLDFIEDENDFSMYSPVSADIQLNKVSETDSSISISWSGVYGETFSHYEVYCNGAVVQTDLTDTAYTVTGLAGGNEYGISVYAYDIEGNVIGMSDELRACTNLTLQGDRTLYEDIIVQNLYLNSGTLNVNGHTITVKNDLGIGSGTLFVNGGKIYVEHTFRQQWTNGNASYGYLKMTNPNDYICVNGDFYCYAAYSHSGWLTNGTLEVKGNFTQRRYSDFYNFCASDSHRVILSGEKLQTVTFDRTESRFNILEVRNYSADGVIFSTPVTMNKYIDNGCNVTFSNGERTGWTLEADETIEGDLNLSTGVLDLNGHNLTITGNFIHSGGTVLVNGGELEVQGDYRVQALNGTSYTNSTGVLNMTNEADTVKVMGQFVMQSTASHSGKLTAGTLEIGGNLTQAGANAYNFCTSGSHTVVLNGTEKQSVSINDNYRDYSRFNNLKITNTSAEGVTFSRMAYVVGNLYNTETKITNGSNIYVPTSMKFADNAWNHDIWICENRTLSEDLEIGGTLYLNGGTLNLNGHTLTVKGNVYLSNAYINVNKGKLYADGNFNMSYTNGSGGSGYLTMTNAEDYICVNGNLYIASYYDYSKLTNGTIEVKGNFTQKHISYPNNFVPSGNHKVILSGGKLQKVDFATTQSYFNILEITKPLDTGYVFSRTPLWNELIEGKADTEAPTAPKNLKFVRSNSSSIAMTWGASSDNAAIYCYYIYRNGERVGNTTKTEYIDNGLKSHTSYEYYIVACDTSRNLSEWSNILEASTDVDAFAPTQPANLAAKIQSEGVVRLSWTASSDNGTVVKYNVYRNGTLIGSSNGTAFTDSTAFGGYYEYYVEAVDNEDNVSRASASVFIDNLAPTAPVLTLNSVKDDYVSLSWECSDNVGVVKYDLYRNDVKIKSFNANVYVDTAVSLDTNYTYYVKAYDAAGNVSENSNEVTVYTGEDDVAPVISSIEYTGKPSFKNTVITVSATDNCGVSKIFLKYSSDKINWTDCGSETASGKAAVTVKFGVDTSEMTDGTVYLCAYAEDINGNVSTIENSPVYSFSVDNTAPDAPTGVVCTSEDDTIEVKWNAGGKDVSYFRIYRKAGDGEYSLIKDNYRYINYFESDIELGTVYTYKVTAVDENGNESDYSDEVTGCISEDNTKPQVFSVYPASGSKIGENPEISVSCYDNFKLRDVTVQGKAENTDEWSDLYHKEIDTYAEIISFTLNTSKLETGKYQIKVSLTDSALNKSEDYIVTYDYRNCTLSAPVLTAEGSGWSVNLSWTMENTEEIAGYYVYRRSSSSAKYSLIGSTAKSSVTDYDVTAGQKYYYYVEAMDIRGNKVKGEAVSAVPTSEDTIAPTAYAGEGLFGIAGKAVSFDGTGSTDNHYVASYKWDFGDGTTSTEARPKHTYSEAGTYKVSLTVYDSAENSDTHTTEVEIYGEDYNAVKIRVRGDNGAVLSGARVYCELTGGKIDATTDSTGCYDFIAKKGSYDVYFYIAGYLPKMVTVSVTGEASVVNVVLPKGEVVVGNLTTRPLELKEILALGIDPKAPENRSVCEYTVNLTYNKNSKTLWLTTNAEGEIIKIKETFNENWTVCAKTIGSGRSGGGGSGGSGGGGSGSSESKSIALFSITTEISWLKEFYNVDLTVINNADDNFTLENCTADLTLPSGLSLAKTERGESSHIKAGMIAGGETKTMSWVVRGDKKGEYYLSADFNCVLTPFMEEIKLEFKNEKPLVVYGGDALELDVDYTGFDPNSDYWTARFTLTNVSDKPVYDVDIDFRAYKYFDDIEISDMMLEYPSGLKEHIPWTGKDSSDVKSEPDNEHKEEFYPALYGDEFDELSLKTLNPGESITGYYSVSNFQHHIPR